MSMFGLRTLPVNHRLHPVYRAVGAVVGLLLVAFAVVGLRRLRRRARRAGEHRVLRDLPGRRRGR